MPYFPPATATAVSTNPNLFVLGANYTIPANYSLVSHGEYEIADGIGLEIADTARLEID